MTQTVFFVGGAPPKNLTFAPENHIGIDGLKDDIFFSGWGAISQTSSVFLSNFKPSPNAPCIDYVHTWRVKNGHMNKGKWLGKYSHPMGHFWNQFCLQPHGHPSPKADHMLVKYALDIPKNPFPIPSINRIGIFTYMNGWFLWLSCRYLEPKWGPIFWKIWFAP